MEDQVFNIIENNYNFFKGVNEAHIASSKEIAAHFMKFLVWYTDNDSEDISWSYDKWINNISK